MSGTGGFAVSRSHGGDRFYNPPALRRQHQQQMMLQQQQQQQLQRQQNRAASSSAAGEAGNRTDSDDSSTAFSRTPSSVRCASPPVPPAANATNLDRLMESVTLSVNAEDFPEVNARAWRTREADLPLSYCLGDLWESLREWSVYGVGVPLLLYEKCSTMQYYVPFLSGIQLYVDPAKASSRLSMPGEGNNAKSSRETSSGGSSDCDVDRQSKSVDNGVWNQHDLLNLNSQRLNRLSMRDKLVTSASTDEADSSNSPGELLFEYLEHEQPHLRKPLADKIMVLASQFPVLRTFRSCDLLPTSWICVAWYPIYRIPMGPTLKDLDASFLTFHPLSTNSRSNVQPNGVSGRKIIGGADGPLKISLPAFGLASYKLKNSILTPCGPHESEQESSLLQAAHNWLQSLQVALPDYQFFRSHYLPWR